MKIIDGKVTMETKECLYCHGKGQREEWVSCPNYGKAMRGKACPHCGSTTKHNHRPINTGNIIECDHCKGVGRVDETLYDYADNLYSAMEFRVYRQNRAGSWNEMHFGAGCVYSCTDYGAAWNHPENDAGLIAKVKGNTGQQAVKFCKENEDGTGTPANHIGIFVTRDGYSVRAVYTLAETVARIQREPNETTARIVGGALAAAGMNGTAFAAGGLS
jgi:hypothetical protein